MLTTSKPDHGCCRNLDNEIVIVLFLTGIHSTQGWAATKRNKVVRKRGRQR